jgi:aldehyde dehydrogenase (NAD+)
MRTPELSVAPDDVCFIGDAPVGGTGDLFEHVYAATGEPTRVVRLASQEQVDAAVRSARTALPAWRGLSAQRRRDLMLSAAQLIRERRSSFGSLSVLETGITMDMMLAGIDLVAEHFIYCAGWVDKFAGEVVPTWPGPAFDYTLNNPYGVVGVLVPWNGPVQGLGGIIAPALAAGNCVVAKPSELTPFSCSVFAALLVEAGFPPGVVNIVPGGAEVGRALVAHPGIDKIHLTGSAAVARRVMASAAEHLTPVSFELGGKSANIVFEDADIDEAARVAVRALIRQSGQSCVAPTRVVAHRSVHDAVVERAVTMLQDIVIGDPMDPRSDLGPVVSLSACDRILRSITGETDHGSGALVAGGSRLGGDLAAGFFVAPTIFARVDPSAELAQEETFGPVISTVVFDDETEAVRIANSTRYGLGAYVQTRDLRRAHRLAQTLEAGNIWINGTQGIPVNAPFGGVKDSGFGRLGGLSGIREFSRPKNVWTNLS